MEERESRLTDMALAKQTTSDATKFYTKKVEDLGKNLNYLEKVVQGKSENLRVVEEGKDMKHCFYSSALGC